MVRKIFYGALLAIFLFNTGGYYLWFKILQHRVQQDLKQEIRKGLKEDELAIIIIPLNGKNDIRWKKPHKEFIYHGEMYDLIKTKIQDQKIYYYCINDTREKELIANFNKNHNSKKELEKKIKRSPSSKYFHQQYALSHNDIAVTYTYGTLHIYYNLNKISPPSPPPKQA